ncbi:MAG: hypothetical protein GC158_16015 [Cyanobacteria bacterium RI_101]|nr:hypothetical protein [Cyanobacteria bacterium RI_101]
MLQFALLGTLLFASALPPQAAPIPSLVAQAAPSVSNQELEQVARILVKFQGIAEKTQTDIDQAVQAAGLTPQRFLEIAQQVRAKGSPGAKPIPAQDEAKFEKALPQVQKILQASIKEQQAILGAEKISSKDFDQRMEKIRQDIKLQEQVQKLMNGGK